MPGTPPSIWCGWAGPVSHADVAYGWGEIQDTGTIRRTENKRTASNTEGHTGQSQKPRSGRHQTLDDFSKRHNWRFLVISSMCTSVTRAMNRLALVILLIAACQAGKLKWDEDHLIGSDSVAGDYFGQSLAMSGDRLVVGAYGDDDLGFNSGSVYVFQRSGNGWVQEAKLLPDHGSSGEYFGHSVAMDGNIIIVGAYGTMSASGTDTGAVYIYEFHTVRKKWQFKQRVTANTPNMEDSFGTAVSISGGVFVVGAYNSNNAGMKAGAAHVYEYTGRTWALAAVIQADDGIVGDRFGRAVAVSGGTIAVGAYLANVDRYNNAGAVYTFGKDQDGKWAQQVKVAPKYSCEGEAFGFSLALDGDILAVGAYGATDSGVDSGAVYIFHVSVLNVTQVKRLTSPVPLEHEYFGYSISLDHHVLAVGAHNNGARQGHVYVFDHAFDGVWWNLRTSFSTDAGQAMDYYGQTVANTGNNVLVGAYYTDRHDQTAVGAAYVYHPECTFWYTGTAPACSINWLRVAATAVLLLIATCGGTCCCTTLFVVVGAATTAGVWAMGKSNRKAGRGIRQETGYGRMDGATGATVAQPEMAPTYMVNDDDDQ